jgi:hypothetical protein
LPFVTFDTFFWTSAAIVTGVGADGFGVGDVGIGVGVVVVVGFGVVYGVHLL